MKRKDQLNITIASDLKEAWREWAQKRGTNITALIEGLALHCVEGKEFKIPDISVEVDDSLKKMIRAEVQKAIADLNGETVSPLKEVRGATIALPKTTQDIADTVTPTPVVEGEKLTLSQLATSWGKAKSTIFGNAKELEHFQEWSIKNSPDRRPWTFTGNGNDRRFYPLTIEEKINE